MFKDPYIIACGHTLCKTCLTTGSQLDTRGSLCRQSLDVGFKNVLATSALSRFHAKCPNGCFMQVEVHNLVEHNHSCPLAEYRRVVPPLKGLCGKPGVSNEFESTWPEETYETPARKE